VIDCVDAKRLVEVGCRHTVYQVAAPPSRGFFLAWADRDEWLVRPLKDGPDLVVGGPWGQVGTWLFGEEQESNSTTAIDSAANRIRMAAIYTGIPTVIGAGE
jgi:hypothetical protein